MCDEHVVLIDVIRFQTIGSSRVCCSPCLSLGGDANLNVEKFHMWYCTRTRVQWWTVVTLFHFSPAFCFCFYFLPATPYDVILLFTVCIEIVISTRDHKTGRFFIPLGWNNEPVLWCRGSNIAFYYERSIKSRYGHVSLLAVSAYSLELFNLKIEDFWF
jgi:hypothetical protein